VKRDQGEVVVKVFAFAAGGPIGQLIEQAVSELIS
jgi:hypothetical protein